MTNSTSLLAEGAWTSEREIVSAQFPGVRIRIARFSFARRLELARRVRDLAQRAEFFAAGASAAEQLESAVLSNEIDRVYAEWGLLGVDGLTIDGEPADPQSLIERGPIALVEEAITAIKEECGLSAEERKN